MARATEMMAVLAILGFDLMFFSVLGSGSRGNSVYVESDKTGILIDAGFSGKEMQRRLASINRNLADVSAICITHEHNDHICGAGVIARRCRIPVYANIATFYGSEKKIGKVPELIEFETGAVFEIDGLSVRSFRISHDSRDPVGFVISDGRTTLGYCTDTGNVTHLMTTRLAGCNGLILEFNHNLELLKNGPYPLSLQQRVRSRKGHLSNEDAAAFLSTLHSEYMQVVVLAHLSQQNNRPVLAEQAALSAVKDWGETLLKVAGQDETSGLIRLR